MQWFAQEDAAMDRDGCAEQEEMLSISFDFLRGGGGEWLPNP